MPTVPPILGLVNVRKRPDRVMKRPKKSKMTRKVSSARPLAYIAAQANNANAVKHDPGTILQKIGDLPLEKSWTLRSISSAIGVPKSVIGQFVQTKLIKQ